MGKQKPQPNAETPEVTPEVAPTVTPEVTSGITIEEGTESLAQIVSKNNGAPNLAKKPVSVTKLPNGVVIEDN